MNDFDSSKHFFSEAAVAPLGVISLEGAADLGNKIHNHLVTWANESDFNQKYFAVESECPRFSSGDGKGIIKSSIRGTDLFIIADVGNYSCSYNMFGENNHMSPDDHFQDLKRIIQAASGKAHRISVVMPMLYGSRQHRRNYRESLDCAVALQELQNMGIINVITFDTHDPRVQNAVPYMGFDNVMPTYQVLKSLISSIPDIRPDSDNFMIISPDEGALHRNMYYASVLGVNMGMFYKRRDYSTLVNGRNPIVAHEYLGESVVGKDIFIADDIISSGESMLDIAYELKEQKAGKIFAYATYGIFTNGFDAFDKAYNDGIIDGIFSSNLTYVPDELKSRKWYYEVDCSKYAAYFIAAINRDMSISEIVNPHEKIKNLLAKLN